MDANFPEHDTAVADWMAQRGWPVTFRHYDPERDVLAWRAAGVIPSITLRITLEALEDVPAHILASALNGLNVAAKLMAAPAAYMVLKRDASAAGVRVEQLAALP